jgi:hypothetical protein
MAEKVIFSGNGGAGHQAIYGQANLSIPEMHVSKSNSNILSPPAVFPTQNNIFVPIHRSHSSGERKTNESKQTPVFGDLAKTSFEQFAIKK